MSRAALAVLALVTIGGLALWLTGALPASKGTPNKENGSKPGAGAEAGRHLPPSTLSKTNGPGEESLTQADLARRGSPLAAELNAPDQDAEKDVLVLQQLIGQYLTALQGKPGRPIGDNMDLTRALTGNNRLKMVAIPPGHPALGTGGRLLDRWGTPYHLHPVGGGLFSVRSAGPDRRLFTADDVVTDQ